MPKCLKCDLDNVPEDHALRCPMRNHVCPTYPFYPTWTTPVYPQQPMWISTTPNTSTFTICGSGCNHT